MVADRNDVMLCGLDGRSLILCRALSFDVHTYVTPVTILGLCHGSTVRLLAGMTEAVIATLWLPSNTRCDRRTLPGVEGRFRALGEG